MYFDSGDFMDWLRWFAMLFLGGLSMILGLALGAAIIAKVFTIISAVPL
ncbi:hypothetical protein SDC9_65423 [bioreactor metagenome]|uniref:Uncharacterized protein n=1 Tax=bioreactor metagenome TaxID=1076179 RepID=A0A644XS84_9ZZZZ